MFRASTTDSEIVGSIPTCCCVFGCVVKLADTQDLGSCAERHAGSTPAAATIVLGSHSWFSIAVLMLRLWNE